MAQAYIALGSNIGDPVANLTRALAQLAQLGMVSAVSSYYDTAPVGYDDQPRFVNAACLLETALSPQDLLIALKRIEGRLGRTAAVRNGPRVIDLDILLYDDLVLRTAPLEIPHPRLHERAFVLRPLEEIAPYMRHPLLNQTVRQLSQATGQQDVRPLAADAHSVSPAEALGGATGGADGPRD